MGPGSTVYIAGAGPVGLAAAASARLLGAAVVIVGDVNPKRLVHAKAVGFEVVDLGKASKVKFAAVSSRIYDGSHIGTPDVRHFRCYKIKMTLKNRQVADKFLLDVDGEPLGRLPLEIELVPGAIEVLVP